MRLDFGARVILPVELAAICIDKEPQHHALRWEALKGLDDVAEPRHVSIHDEVLRETMLDCSLESRSQNSICKCTRVDDGVLHGVGEHKARLQTEPMTISFWELARVEPIDEYLN